MPSNSVCNHTHDKQIGLPLPGRPILLYDYRLNWTPLSPITITNQGLGKRYQPQPSASADNPYLDLDYSGYHKNLIQ